MYEGTVVYCKHQPGNVIACSAQLSYNRDCSLCGWNPKVDQRRREQLKERMLQEAQANGVHCTLCRHCKTPCGHLVRRGGAG